MVKISQAQTPVGSIQGRVPLSRVSTNRDDDDDFDYFIDISSTLLVPELE